MKKQGAKQNTLNNKEKVQPLLFNEIRKMYSLDELIAEAKLQCPPCEIITSSIGNEKF